MPQNRPRRPKEGVEAKHYSFLNLVARQCGWSTPHPGSFTLQKDPVTTVQEAGWDRGRSGRMTTTNNNNNNNNNNNRQQNQYKELANQIRAMWKQKAVKVIPIKAVKVIPIVIPPTGVIPKSLPQSLTRLNLHPNTYIQIQKSVILGTCSIVRNFLNYK